jgi:predicted nucleic acid-binding protein
MPSPVYFDTNVFIDLFAKNSKHASKIRELLLELRREKIRIYTSMLTVQEISVLTFRRGRIARDNYSEIARLARIWTIDKDIALTAAKREAELRDMFHETEEEAEMKQRRRWDSIHVATAQVLRCSRLFTTDAKLMRRKQQWDITDLEFCLPLASSPLLEFPPTPSRLAIAASPTSAPEPLG